MLKFEEGERLKRQMRRRDAYDNLLRKYCQIGIKIVQCVSPI